MPSDAQLRESFAASQQAWGSGGTGTGGGAGGLQILDYNEGPRVCRITNTGANPYSGTPQYWTGSAWADFDSSVAPSLTSMLYELSGSTSVPINTRVLAYPNPTGPGFVFASGSFNLTVKESDGTPSYAGITSIELDQDDGFSLTQPGAGRVKVNYGITVKESDGSPSYSPVSSLEFDDVEFFVVTQPGAKRAKISRGTPTSGEANESATMASHGTPFYSVATTGVLPAGRYRIVCTATFTSTLSTAGIGLIEARFYNLTASGYISAGGLHYPGIVDSTVFGSNPNYSQACWQCMADLDDGDEITTEFNTSGSATFNTCGSTGGVMTWHRIGPKP